MAAEPGKSREVYASLDKSRQVKTGDPGFQAIAMGEDEKNRKSRPNDMGRGERIGVSI